MDAVKVKKDFPILSRKIHGKPLVYLDNGATSQKPRKVIDAIVDYYENHNANVHRGIHVLGDESTKMYRGARENVAKFFGATSEELVFVRNTTEAINTVAYSWARNNLGITDLIVTSELEHHSNLVTWQEVARATGAGLVFLNVTDDGQIDMEDLDAVMDGLADQVALVALSGLSNATGAVLDVEKVVAMRDKYAKRAKILIDGAQMAPHMKINFDKSGVDFLAFSGHKMYGPMGIGGLLVKREIISKMQPFMVGGGMISEVALEKTEYADVPDRFDAGTPDVAGAVGLSAACDYLSSIGMAEVEKHGKELVEYALGELGKLKKVKIVGPWPERQIQNSKSQITNNTRLGSVAFIYEGVHAHDVAQVLDGEGIAVRSGHHCTMPLHTKFNWVATTRASFGIYNSKEDIDVLIKALEKVEKVFG